jgi:hypothetical protein
VQRIWRLAGLSDWGGKFGGAKMGIGFKIIDALQQNNVCLMNVAKVRADLVSILSPCRIHPKFFEECAEIIERTSGVNDLVRLLIEYRRLYPVFESMNIGAPGSVARKEQEEKINLAANTDFLLYQKYEGAE